MPRRTTLALISALTLPLAHLHAQAARQTPAEESTIGDDGTVLLSPFQVDTSKDQGYRATNATSGTRLNTAIKDAPLPIEVITKDFMRDIGATNLREALQYSAGVILDSQNDALYDPQGGQDIQPGSSGANNPQGVTGSNSNTGTKLRGFIVDQTLRDGFRRQFSTDWINIERIEVVRGPEALLYGVGSFGGVYNYIPKRPQQTKGFYGSASIGTNDYYRAEFDVTGALGDGNHAWQPAFRVTGAWQQNEDHTEWYNNKQLFVSPVVSFRPFANTEVLIDTEFGRTRQQGTGFQNVRLAAPGSGAQHRGAVYWPGSHFVNMRTYRMSGPDTHLDVDFYNILIDVTHKFTENLFLRAGGMYNVVERSSRDVTSTAFANASEMFLSSDPLTIRPDGQPRQSLLTGLVPDFSLNNLFANQNDPNAQAAGTPRLTTMRYKWEERDQKEERLQYRADLNYSFEAWGKHSVLLGLQTQYREEELQNRGPVDTYTNFNPSFMRQYSFRSPYDFGPIRFGTQGDGLPDPELVDLDFNVYKNWDLGYYLAYQGRFWDDRITLIGGYRWDRNDARSVTLARDSGEVGGVDRSEFAEEAPNEWSPQIGLSFRVNRALSLFGVYSTGLIPNYNQPDGNGQLEPTSAKSVEYGVKFDLMDGRISGTVSAYKIERENTPRNIWWAPAPYREPENPLVAGAPMATIWQTFSAQNLWYAMKNTPNGHAIAKQIFPSGWHTFLDRMNTVPASPTNPLAPNDTSPEWGGWGDPTAPGDAWNDEAGHLWGDSNRNTAQPDNGATTYWPLVNLNNPEHQAFAINALQSMGRVTPGAQYQWAGNFFGYNNGQRLRFGDGTIGVQNTPSWNSAAVPINDESKGWDAQILFRPTDNWQIVLNYANTERQITSQALQYVEAPYFPLAMWYYPTFGWGTLDARPAEDAYTDVQNTSTFIVPLPEYGQSLDDTPKHQGTIWTNYKFDNDSLRGWEVGLGVRYESERQYYSGFAVDGTANQVEIDGVRVFTQFWTDKRYTVDTMVAYNTRIGNGYNLRVALNVYNLLDDQSRYGFIYAPGMTARLTTSISF